MDSAHAVIIAFWVPAVDGGCAVRAMVYHGCAGGCYAGLEVEWLCPRDGPYRGASRQRASGMGACCLERPGSMDHAGVLRVRVRALWRGWPRGAPSSGRVPPRLRLLPPFPTFPRAA